MVEVSCFSTTTADAINTAKPCRAACDDNARTYLSKQMVSRLAIDNTQQWTFRVMALRKVSKKTIGLPPSTLVFGRQTRGPLAILKETWEDIENDLQIARISVFATIFLQSIRYLFS